ncbi:MAG: SURF1 family protein, partial [Gemmatimonadales bacterium]
WQGRRLAGRRAANEATLERRSLPVVVLNDPATFADLTERRVVASGKYDHPHSLVLRGRLEREVPGVFLVTPLQLDGRPDAVLVLRGFVPAADAHRPDTNLLARPDRVTVEGVALPVTSRPDSGIPLAPTGGGLTSWRRLDLAALRRRIPYPLLDVYVHEITAGRQDGKTAGTDQDRPFPRPVALPALDDGPHLAYMIQWFGIAVVAAGFGVAVLRKRTIDD